MSVRSILVPQWAGHTSDAALEAALAIAWRSGAHLDVVYVQPGHAQATAPSPGASPGSTGLPGEAEDVDRAAAADARAHFGLWCQLRNLPNGAANCRLRSTFGRWSERLGHPEQVIVRKGRVSDLIALSFRREAPGFERALDAAVFDSGRPVLLVPVRRDDDPLRHVAVAWNGSLEATRAVAAAMPLLHHADRVTLLSVQGYADPAFAEEAGSYDIDLVEALSWHGIRGDHRRIKAGTVSVGQALLDTAAHLDASMLISGAYTHSRVTSAFLGGVTGHVLNNPPTFPVLMVH